MPVSRESVACGTGKRLVHPRGLNKTAAVLVTVAAFAMNLYSALNPPPRRFEAEDWPEVWYQRGTYIGLVREYWDETALIQEFDEDPDHYYVQFDNRWLPYAYGWHKFPKSDWRIDG